MHKWDGSCQRCGQKSSMHIMSMFDLCLICMTCKHRETRHPRYKEACEAECEALKCGDRGFRGIGVPEDLLNAPT